MFTRLGLFNRASVVTLPMNSGYRLVSSIIVGRMLGFAVQNLVNVGIMCSFLSLLNSNLSFCVFALALMVQRDCPVFMQI
jgi:hypothetical protein